MNRSHLLVLSLAALATALTALLIFGRSGDDAPPAPRPVGPVVGSHPHSRATLIGLRRTGPKVVTARLSVTLDRRAPGDWLPELEGPDGAWYTAQGQMSLDVPGFPSFDDVPLQPPFA